MGVCETPKNFHNFETKGKNVKTELGLGLGIKKMYTILTKSVEYFRVISQNTLSKTRETLFI